MYKKKRERSYQEEFIAYVICMQPTEYSPSEFSLPLNKKTQHRIFIYKNSFIGRIVSSLTEKILGPVCNLFEEEMVKEIVARYFVIHPPQSSCMISVLNCLPEFILRNNKDWYSQLLSEMIKLCLQYHKFIYSSNENKFDFFHSELPADFFAAWSWQSQSAPLNIDRFRTQVNDSSQILFFRKNPNQILEIKVPKNLAKFVSTFILENSVINTLKILSDKEIEAIDNISFEEFILEMKKNMAV